jgi:serine/threonine-protein kinase RIO1
MNNLNKFYINELINKIDTFTIFSGKEANVYHTTDFKNPEKEYALKIYKTMVIKRKRCR